jgi:hypothetical protein
MKRHLVLLAIPAALALSGCETGGYYGGGIAYGTAYPYEGYYDGYYGPVYDGYWGNDGYFYYRGNGQDNHYHRGDHAHFNHQAGNGGNWQHVQGAMQPSHGMHAPNFPHTAQAGGHSGGHDRGDHPEH